MDVALRDESFYANYGHCRLLNRKRTEKILLARRRSDSRFVAVKIEKISKKRRAKGNRKQEGSSLEHEYAVYKHLRGSGVPNVRWFGIVDGHRASVMDLMGPALEELFVYCEKRFSLKTVLMLADQMLDRIQCLHDAGYVHGDVTPDNFVMGIERYMAKVYMVNMKWASKYISNTRNRKHIPYKENVEFYGSPRFASLNRHLGAVASRRDDLESCIYVILYFLKGGLPWQKYERSCNSLERILEMKASLSTETLCHGLPPQFAMILNYCRTLKFDAEPDYIFIRQLLRNLFKALAYEEDWNFDWLSRYSARQ